MIRRYHSSGWRTCIVFGAASFALGLMPGSAAAKDVWTEVARGIRHLHRELDVPVNVHVLLIDLTVPANKVAVTAYDDRWQTTSAFARRTGAIAAVNGGNWDAYSQRAERFVAGSGSVWSQRQPKDIIFATFADSTARILRADEFDAVAATIVSGVAGTPLLIEDGKIRNPEGLDRLGRDARTAVGISRDGRRVILATVDGRIPESRGASLFELAKLLQEFGAWRGLNLDGGKSTSFAIPGEGGLLNYPSLQREREVVSHVGVYADTTGFIAPAAVVSKTPRAFENIMHRAISASDRSIRQLFSPLNFMDYVDAGPVREIAVPGGILVAVLVALAATLFAVRLLLRLAFRARRTTANTPDKLP